ncbi:MAG: class I SAM-dependent methyltransferase [Anaerolineales bacterium]|nr:class I SAM-dependent methyltransferase [Anaerolineales bacterium]
MPNDQFDPRAYWEERLTAQPNLRGVGHRRFSMDYNAAMYQVALENLDAVLALGPVAVPGRRVLDIGPGLGHFLRRYVERGAGQVLGVDITAASVAALQAEFPQHRFQCADVSDLTPAELGQHDLVSVINVIFHIVDEGRFERTLRTLGRCVAPGGYFLLVDSLYGGPQPAVTHARPRPLARYRPLLAEVGLTVRAIRPMYYIMGHPLLPVLLAPLIDRPAVLPYVVRFERWLARRAPVRLSAMQYLLAQAPAQPREPSP